MSEHDSGYDPYNSATTRTAPPIPDYLRNDPELETLAISIVRSFPRWAHLDETIPARRVEWPGERYRK